MSQTDVDAPDTDTDIIDEVYGGLGAEPVDTAAGLKSSFYPWHHPVKQLVRDEQWSKLVGKLLEEDGVPSDGILRYLTLPGDDLMDVRVVAEACGGRAKLRYLGFNSADSSAEIAPWAEAQAALQQESLADPQSQIVHDRIEDIAAAGSSAASLLQQLEPFDIVNLDACNHLANVHPGRVTSLFDALTKIVEHQLRARRTWLLFVTTRVSSAHVGDGPKADFNSALVENLAANGEFEPQLRGSMQFGKGEISSELEQAWKKDGMPLLRLFALSLGKHVMRFINAQPNFQARVELASSYCYRIHSEDPDMLAMAFRIRPGEMRIAKPGIVFPSTPPEPRLAMKIMERSLHMYDLDEELRKDEKLLRVAVDGTKRLLQICNYDLTAYTQWISKHPTRAIQIMT